jgi:hypothetical protein
VTISERLPYRTESQKGGGKGHWKVRRYLLWQNISVLLKQKNRTWKWLAGECGCSPATIRNYVKGSVATNPVIEQKLLRALGVSENQLYGLSQQLALRGCDTGANL